MTLTEQWKKGELPFGAYYVNRLEEHRIWLYNDRSKTPESQHEIYEVLAPVPSYEEYSRLEWYAGCGPDRIVELNKENRQLRKWCEEFNALDVAKENQQLKEMLYKCREKLDWLNGGYDVWGGELTDFIEEIDEVLK